MPQQAWEKKERTQEEIRDEDSDSGGDLLKHANISQKEKCNLTLKTSKQTTLPCKEGMNYRWFAFTIGQILCRVTRVTFLLTAVFPRLLTKSRIWLHISCFAALPLPLLPPAVVRALAEDRISVQGVSYCSTLTGSWSPRLASQNWLLG